jgi:hypothetical protein
MTSGYEWCLRQTAINADAPRAQGSYHRRANYWIGDARDITKKGVTREETKKKDKEEGI